MIKILKSLKKVLKINRPNTADQRYILLIPAVIIICTDILAGVKIAEKMTATLEQWGIKKEQVLLIVTDNGSNMVKAVKVMND